MQQKHDGQMHTHKYAIDNTDVKSAMHTWHATCCWRQTEDWNVTDVHSLERL